MGHPVLNCKVFLDLVPYRRSGNYLDFTIIQPILGRPLNVKLASLVRIMPFLNLCDLWIPTNRTELLNLKLFCYKCTIENGSCEILRIYASFFPMHIEKITKFIKQKFSGEPLKNVSKNVINKCKHC